jgi:hypothetical protein
MPFELWEVTLHRLLTYPALSADYGVFGCRGMAFREANLTVGVTE